MKRLLRHLLILFAAAALTPAELSACQRRGPVVPEDIVATADLIVRATAVDYTRPPATSDVLTTGTPDSLVHFRVDEVIKGSTHAREIDLPGYLSLDDDFNDVTVPYKFVRPGGRSGSCFANTYRRGVEFLLMLKLVDGTYTVDWYPLGPTNEQLHSSEDLWLKWVRAEAARHN